MRSLLVKLLALSLVLFIAGCGVDDEGDGTPDGEEILGEGEDLIEEGADPEATASLTTLTLSADSNTLDSGGADSVTLTVTARNQDNNVVENAGIRFAADSDSALQVTRGVTDESGQAEAKLTSIDTNRLNRTINVAARSAADEDIRAEISIAVRGTQLSIDGPRNLPVNASDDYSLRLRDSEGSAIEGIEVTLGSEGGLTVSPDTVTTNDSGEAAFSVQADSAGERTIVAEIEGATGTRTVSVSDDSFQFLTPDDAQAFEVNSGPHPVRIEWTTGPNQDPVSGQDVVFTSSLQAARFDGGSENVVTETTDGDGEAATDIQSSQSGQVEVTATSPDESISATQEIRFFATEPDDIQLQAFPSVIAPNEVDSESNRSTITAILRDDDGNVVPDQDISFSVEDGQTGGRVSPNTAVTDGAGRASTEYIAGNSSTGIDGVSIEAVAISDTDITEEINLTVAEARFVTVSFSGKVDISEDERNRVPFSVQLTDDAGNPVANESVSVSLQTTTIYEGTSWTFDDAEDEWVRPTSTTACTGVGDTFGTASITAAEGTDSSSEGGKIQLVTNDQGYADFEMVYPPNHASWSDVEITATATVNNSRSFGNWKGELPVPFEEVDSEPAPPFEFSPFDFSDIEGCP